ncbi:MAG: hypothetical protein ACREER_01220 [Alphaproteobacteria bacterium]
MTTRDDDVGASGGPHRCGLIGEPLAVSEIAHMFAQNVSDGAMAGTLAACVRAM